MIQNLTDGDGRFGTVSDGLEKRRKLMGGEGLGKEKVFRQKSQKVYRATDASQIRLLIPI